jgi:hypothetical protein
LKCFICLLMHVANILSWYFKNRSDAAVGTICHNCLLQLLGRRCPGGEAERSTSGPCMVSDSVSPYEHAKRSASVGVHRHVCSDVWTLALVYTIFIF